jgi:hypothetical protein
MTINIEWQDQFGRWHHYQSKQNQFDAYRVAQRCVESTKKRQRLVEGDGETCQSLKIQFPLTRETCFIRRS